MLDFLKLPPYTLERPHQGQESTHQSDDQRDHEGSAQGLAFFANAIDAGGGVLQLGGRDHARQSAADTAGSRDDQPHRADLLSRGEVQSRQHGNGGSLRSAHESAQQSEEGRHKRVELTECIR